MDRNSDTIQVMVRVRPFNQRERIEDSKACVIIEDYRPNCLILDAKPEQKVFNFDWVGGDSTTQQDIFEVVGKPMVNTCLEGYNCCIFAYGQTGAGKTFTMQGRGLDGAVEDFVTRGLQPRVFDYIFSLKAKDMEENPGTNYLIVCTYLEIYNEQIKDLVSIFIAFSNNDSWNLDAARRFRSEKTLRRAYMLKGSLRNPSTAPTTLWNCFVKEPQIGT